MGAVARFPSPSPSSLSSSSASSSSSAAFSGATPEEPEAGTPTDLRIAAAARGDRAAAHALLVDVAPRIRNLIRYLTHYDSDVDDIAQEAMVTILRHLGSYRGEGTFVGWVDRVTMRTTFSVLRQRKQRREDPLESSPEPAHDAFGEFHARRRLVALLDGLPAPQRYVVVLHFMLGMSIAELAEELDAPIETIRSRLRLGKDYLRKRGLDLHLESPKR